MSIRDFSKRPKILNEHYLSWVRSLPCCGCGIQGRLHAHHCIADRHSSSKHSDLAAMSLCPDCHRELHADWRQWEVLYGPQWRHVYRTIELAVQLEILNFDNQAARELGA